MIARKGIDVLLHAFSLLVKHGVPARLHLIGREADLPRFLSELPAETRALISYHGFRSPADLPAVFASADVFVLPSRHDGWGVVVNQALAAGLPVIASDAVGAAHDLIVHEISGLIVPAGNTSALEVAMRRLALSSALRDKLAAASATVVDRISPESAAGFWESLAQGADASLGPN
jgi:glycosyltransferase involved in cell wall biosynthesis